MGRDLALRLRELRDRRGWTVTDMSERTGIPKRSMDKYMLRSGASLPGFDALTQLSRGLGVSLDWLVFGADFASEGVALLAQKAARDASLGHFEAMLEHHRSGERPVFEGDLILGLSPEWLAADVGARAGDVAREMASRGATLQELTEWHAALKERLLELAQEHSQRVVGSKRQQQTSG